jgi:hypothetical protein
MCRPFASLPPLPTARTLLHRDAAARVACPSASWTTAPTLCPPPASCQGFMCCPLPIPSLRSPLWSKTARRLSELDLSSTRSLRPLRPAPAAPPLPSVLSILYPHPSEDLSPWTGQLSPGSPCRRKPIQPRRMRCHTKCMRSSQEHGAVALLHGAVSLLGAVLLVRPLLSPYRPSFNAIPHPNQSSQALAPRLVLRKTTTTIQSSKIFGRPRQIPGSRPTLRSPFGIWRGRRSTGLDHSRFVWGWALCFWQQLGWCSG